MMVVNIHQAKTRLSRLQLAQALTQDLTVLPVDEAFDHYGVNQPW